MIQKLFNLIRSRKAGTTKQRLSPLLEKQQAMSRDDIARIYARLFSSDDGKMVLAHMQNSTFLRSYGPDSSADTLRHFEGQRAFVSQIMRLIDIGRTGS